MKKIIIIGLLALCAENYALYAYYSHNEQGYTRKEVAQIGALVTRSVEDAHSRKAGVRFVRVTLSTSSTRQQIAALWNIKPGEIDKPINIFAER